MHAEIIILEAHHTITVESETAFDEAADGVQILVARVIDCWEEGEINNETIDIDITKFAKRIHEQSIHID